jgi:hypothetical protein
MRGGAAVGGVRRWVDAAARDAPQKLPGPKVEAAAPPLKVPGPKVEAADLPMKRRSSKIEAAELPLKLPAPESRPPSFR